MISRKIIPILLFATVVSCIPFTNPLVVRDEKIVYNDSTQIQSIHTPIAYKDPKEINEMLAQRTGSLFFSNQTYTWSDTCNETKAPVVWPVAVAGKVMANTRNPDNIAKAASALKGYRNPSGGYSASMNGNDQIYTDDNAQIAWVFSSAYAATKDEKYLTENKNLTGFLSQQEDKARGGVKWLITSTYIASISNLEVAMAALKYLEDGGGNDEHIPFAKECIVWTLQNLIDNSTTNNFIYDGMYENGSINKGKLTYTIGTLISACAHLIKIGDTDQDWQNIAVTFGVRFISGGKLDNQFFTDGHINDIVERSHLVFVGFADLLELTTPQNDYQKKAYDAFKELVQREARYLYDENSDIINSNSCPSNDFNKLLKFASLSQVFYEAARVVDKI